MVNMKLGRIRSTTMPRQEDGIKQMMTHMPPRSWEWVCDTYLNQGLLSACVGFSWMHFLASTPEPVTGVQHSHAVETYKLARKLDEYPGEDYEGSSISGGVKAVRTMYPHAFDSFHWAFDLDDLVTAVGYLGPVVAGINWYNSMFNPDDIGVIKVGGVDVGGHAILIIGVEIFNRMFKMRNSWGEQWGNKGDCWISFDDMERLIKEDSELCVPTGKHAFGIV